MGVSTYSAQGEAWRIARPGDMKIIDLAAEIRADGGDLRGGVITILTRRPRRYNTPEGRRFLLFGVDDNDIEDDGTRYFTALGLVTRQRPNELREALQVGGLIRIDVEHIEREPSIGMEQPDGWLHLVVGRLTVLTPGSADGMAPPSPDERGIAHIPAPLNAMTTITFRADGSPAHFHMLCLTDEGVAVSRTEKRRRMAVFDTDIRAKIAAKPAAAPNNVAPALIADGNRRLTTIMRLLR